MAEILQDETLQEMSLSDSIESTEFPFIEGVTDISIKVQNTVIHVNSGIIMVASPVLSKMLRSDDKERYKDMIVLPDRNVEDVTLLLKCVYPNKHVRYTDEIVDKVLPLAWEYEMLTVVTLCEDFLISKYLKEKYFINLDDLMKYLYHGATYKMNRIRGHAIDALSQRKSKDIIGHRLFPSIPWEDKSKIFIASVQTLETTTASNEFSHHKKITKYEKACREAILSIENTYKETMEWAARKFGCKDDCFRPPTSNDFKCDSHPIIENSYRPVCPVSVPENCVKGYQGMMWRIPKVIKTLRELNQF